MLPVVRIGSPLLLILPVAVAAAVLAFAGSRGAGVFKKQGVAWGLTALMIVAAIGIGYARAPGNGPAPEGPQYTPSASETVPPGYDPTAALYIRDDANVLSASTENELADRNSRLIGRYDVVIGVVTCSYGRDDLYDYALKRAEELDLRDYDMLVVLDIKGKTCGMIQGAALVDDFTDGDCDRYAQDYMIAAFSAGNYDKAVLSVTEMLEAWYGVYFG